MSDVTWYRVQQEIRETVESDLANGNLDPDCDLDDRAWEYADGDANHIYYHRANTLWADDADVREFEDEAIDLDWSGAETIQDRICLVVFLALRAAYREALDEILDAEVSETQEVVA